MSNRRLRRQSGRHTGYRTQKAVPVTLVLLVVMVVLSVALALSRTSR